MFWLFFLNIYSAKFQFDELFGDWIESNPSPIDYFTENMVQANYHQGNKKYGKTAGTQCTSNAYFTICHSVSKNISDWVTFDLDYILDHGDFLMKLLGTPHTLTVELPLFLNVENNNIEASIKIHYSDIFNNIDLFSNHKHLSDYENGIGAIFTCGSLSFAIIWKKKSIFLFDPHSHPSDGNEAVNNKAILMKFAPIRYVNEFIIPFYKIFIQDTATLQYDILYVNIDIFENWCFPSLDPVQKLTNKAIATNTDFVKTDTAHEKYESGATLCSKWTVLGTYHQRHLKFGGTAGIQFTGNAFFPICFSGNKKVSKWKS